MKKLLLILFLISCSHKLTPEEISKINFGPKPVDYEQIIKNYNESSLFDPYSVVYKFSAPYKGQDGNPLTGKYGWCVPVDINAKNRFGAYTGVTKYHFLMKNDQVIGSGDWFNYNCASVQ